MTGTNFGVGFLDSHLAIARGKVPGSASVNKYGRAVAGIQLTDTDIWDRANAAATQQIWLAPTQARIHAIVSNSVEDSDSGGVVAQGDGCRTIRLWGLKTWSTKETSEDVILDGTTAVNTENTYVIIHRMKMLTHGSLGPNDGTITATAATDGTVTAQINPGQGQTNMTILGIPSTQVAYMTSYDVNSHNTGNPATVVETDFSMLINESPDVDETSSGFINKSNIGMIASGSSDFSKSYDPYLKIEGPAIIKFQAISTLADTEGVAEFDLILIDN